LPTGGFYVEHLVHEVFELLDIAGRQFPVKVVEKMQGNPPFIGGLAIYFRVILPKPATFVATAKSVHQIIEEICQRS